ncbi:putative lipoprotein [Treponema primitia ZAS-2]|uniref:Putative lipoprotein n=2 Tax=Treponema primitia TaxID=88058 RepID=F5YRD8_TREPZ|nr:putative lipoprotein [Treponema primitia ZAS-2]
MKKHFGTISGNTIALAGLFLAAILGFGACANPLSSSPGGAKPSGVSGVEIKIANGTERTLSPDNKSFTSYDVYFSDRSNPDFKETYTGTTVTKNLSPGTWDIYVLAYVGKVQSAFGSTSSVPVFNGQSTGVTIQLSPISPFTSPGDRGSFTYSVQFDKQGVQDYPIPGATLSLSPLSGINSASKNLLNEPSGTIPLAPGFYRLLIQVANNYGMASRSEVVHIYAGKDTAALPISFSPEDFGPFVTINGTVELGGRDDIVGGNIELYADLTFPFISSARASIDPKTGNWTARIKPYVSSTLLYPRLSLQFTDGSSISTEDPSGFDAYNFGADIIDAGSITVPDIHKYTLRGAIDLSEIADADITLPSTVLVYIQRSGVILNYAYLPSARNGNWELAIASKEDLSSTEVSIVLLLSSGIVSTTEYRTAKITGPVTTGLNFKPKVITEDGTPKLTIGSSGQSTFIFKPAGSGSYSLGVIPVIDGDAATLTGIAPSPATNLGRYILSAGTLYSITVSGTANSNYTIALDGQQLRSNADLSDLEVVGDVDGLLTLNPGFSAGITDYEVSYTLTSYHIFVNATADDSNALRLYITNNGSSYSYSSGESISLSPGTNIIKVEVITEAGRLKPYTITVTRQLMSPTPTADITSVANAPDLGYVSFFLTNNPVYTKTTWKVYDAPTGNTEKPGVTAVNLDSTLFLIDEASVTDSVTYYVSATEEGGLESVGRLALTVSNPGEISSLSFNGDIEISYEGSSSPIIISQSGSGYLSTIDLSVSGDYESFSWRVDNVSNIAVTNSITLDATAYETRNHFVTFKGVKDGIPYAKELPFTVVE